MNKILKTAYAPLLTLIGLTIASSSIAQTIPCPAFIIKGSVCTQAQHVVKIGTQDSGPGFIKKQLTCASDGRSSVDKFYPYQLKLIQPKYQSVAGICLFATSSANRSGKPQFNGLLVTFGYSATTCILGGSSPNTYTFQLLCTNDKNFYGRFPPDNRLPKNTCPNCMQNLQNTGWCHCPPNTICDC